MYNNKAVYQFNREARRADEELVSSVPGGALWENWRLQIEERLAGLNSMNADRALLERALRE